MAVTIRLPGELEQRLRAQSADLDAEATVAFALDLFRRGKLSRSELSTVLGFDRSQTDAYLGRKQVPEAASTSLELDEQSRARQAIDQNDAREWLNALRAWADSHQPLDHPVDDSREAIYSGTFDDPR